MIFPSFPLYFSSHPQQFQTQSNSNFQSFDCKTIYQQSFTDQQLFNSSRNCQKLLLQSNIMFSTEINKIYEKTNHIHEMLGTLQKSILLMQQELSHVNSDLENFQKDQSAQILPFDSETCLKNRHSVISSNRTHPKIKLMHKIFGKQQYPFKLAYDGKFPKYLYKKRNISLKILLKNQAGDFVINGNQLSLNLKVYRNDGEEIVLDKGDTSFMNGVCQTTMQKGVGNFSKIHPRQVSRYFSGKGICIFLYATSQQNLTANKGLNINASQIQPLIFYNVKVVVKQQKMFKKTDVKNQSQSQC